jgi:hypothetical protein
LADEIRNAWKGIKMGPVQAKECETAIEASPDDLEARCKLLGYYSSNRFTDPIGLEKYHEHVLFTISTFPENKIAGSQYAHFDLSIDGNICYEKAKSLWLSHVQDKPTNPMILANASSFFAKSEKQLASELSEKLKKLSF